VMHIGIRAHDSTLHVVRVIQRLLCGGLQRQSAPHLRFGVRIQQPLHLFREALQRADDAGVVDPVSGHVEELREKLRAARCSTSPSLVRAERRRPTGTGRPGSERPDGMAASPHTVFQRFAESGVGWVGADRVAVFAENGLPCDILGRGILIRVTRESAASTASRRYVRSCMRR